MAFDIEDVRLKDIEELSKEEKDFLKENQKDLTDSEKDYFKDAWGDEEEEEEEDDKGDKDEEEEDKPFKSFKTQEEHDQYMEEEFKKRKPPKKKVKVKGERIFEKGYKPKDWNVHGEELEEKLYPRFKARLTKEQKEQETNTRQLIADQNKKWDAEIETLRSGGEDIPAPGSKERTTFDKAVTQVLVDYGMSSMTRAYDVWKMKGGKVETKVDKGDDEEQRRKDLAAKVGKGGGTKTKSKDKKYSDTAGKSMDEIFESAEERLS